VYKVFVLWLRERERTKEKNKRSTCCSKKFAVEKEVLAAETKERTKDKKREKKKVSISAAILSLFYLFCVTTFVSRLAFLSKV
jgi:hypothetical protein